jgi:lysophospholipase L1-like esterase
MITQEQIKKTLEKEGKFYIAYVGDSLTSCEWVHPNWRDIVTYVLQMEMTSKVSDWRVASWGVRGFNFGFDGATSLDIVNKLPEIQSVKPNLVIGVMGGNDPTLGISTEQSSQYAESIITKLISAGSQVVWCTSMCSLDETKSLKYSPYATETMKIVDREGLQKINIFEEYKKFPLERIFTFRSEEIPEEDIKEGELDTVHPNQLGNAYLAKIILGEVFGITFDPELYIRETFEGEKYPGY